jgi:GT2 family glycosyltransferase
MRPMPDPAQAAPTLSISLVLHDSDLVLLERTLNCLAVAVERVLAAGGLAGASLEVVDNHSPGDYAGRARAMVALHESATPGYRVEFRSLADNRGYGAGHNRVIAGVQSDLHLVLNPDVELAEDALVQAVRFLRAEPEVVMLAPAARGPDGSVEHLCKDYPSVLVLLVRASGSDRLRRRFRQRLERYELRHLQAATGPRAVRLVSGCCMLIRTGALQAEGGFDEDFFLYFEDFDLSLRLASHGRVLWLPAMQIVHHGGYAARKGWRHVLLFAAGGRRFFRKHGWRWR